MERAKKRQYFFQKMISRKNGASEKAIFFKEKALTWFSGVGGGGNWCLQSKIERQNTANNFLLF